jgi:hypothetical protein
MFDTSLVVISSALVAGAGAASGRFRLIVPKLSLTPLAKIESRFMAALSLSTEVDARRSAC